MKRVFLLTIALSLVWAVASAMAAETVKIGCIAPLTGDVKTFGESQKNAFFLALEEYAKTGKYKITPIVVDDRNDPTEGANGALKLITQDKALAFIGPLTSKVSIPVSEIAEKYNPQMLDEIRVGLRLTFKELVAAFDEVENDAQCRCAVLTGSGPLL